MNDMDDKLIQMARDTGAGEGSPGIFWMTVHKLAAFRSAILADAAKDVQAVAWGIFANNGNIRFWACDKASADSQAAKTGGDVVGIVPAPTLAAAQALNAELVAALQRIARWTGEFPDTGQFWDDGSPMSYSAAFGSNGERDYMRQVALDALSKGQL